jgi:hypothetical protein
MATGEPRGCAGARRSIVRPLLALVGASSIACLHGCGNESPSAKAPQSDLRAEFLKVADSLFASPGGQLDRTQSTVLRRSLEIVGSDVNAETSMRLALVEALLREGKTQEAVVEAEKMYAFLRPRGNFLDKESLPHMIRGLAHLRSAEVENCINRHNDECCVFPLKGGGVHTDKGPAEKAAACFTEWLRVKPDDLAARWLLNVTHMAMGTYPDSVPRQYLIPETGPNSTSDFPRFREVATSCGFTRLNHAGGVIADDIDNDGLIDIVLSSICPDVPLAYYRNKGDGTFEDRAVAAGLTDQLGGLNLVSTDYDNDGDVDIFVPRGGWLFDEGRIRRSLIRNNGDGTFTDVTEAAGMTDTKAPSQVGVWLDYDNDGDLDVFVGNESRVEREFQGTWGPADYPCNLFRNEGNGKFTDVAREAGVTNDRLCKGATAGDYDNDGWMDLFVSNIGKERLYRNNGNGTFTDVAEKLAVTEPAKRSFAPWFFDVDNDGDLDIYVSGYDARIADIAAWHLGQPFKASPPRLYRNKGDGTFEDVTRTYELWRPMAPMGANFGDLDNDGWLDMYLSTGSPEYEALMPNVMLRNVGGRHFKDVTVAGGFGNLQKGHGVAFVDLDNDGDQDVFNEVGGFYQGDVFYNSLYQNPGNANHFLVLKLVGVKSNRLAYGARIKVVVQTPSGERALHRAVGSVSSFGGSPSRQEIGLGDASAIKSVEIWWPRSGTRQNLANLELDAFYEVTEGVDAPKKLTPKRINLGGS